jgi:hypothetical protein
MVEVPELPSAALAAVPLSVKLFAAPALTVSVIDPVELA